jgi:hypothetical protein
VVRITESVSALLKKAKISHKVKYDDLKHIPQ